MKKILLPFLLINLFSFSSLNAQEQTTADLNTLEIDSILNVLGAKTKLTIYENMGHGGPVNEAWNQEDLYEWLLSHKKSK